MTDVTQKKNDQRPVQVASERASRESAESKRLEARRRFLLGGAAALPVALNVTSSFAQTLPPDVDPIGSFSYCYTMTGIQPKAKFDSSLTAWICKGST